MVWQVHKFGGTSVGNAQRYKGVSEIVKSWDKKNNFGIVVSAMKGTTDALIKVVELAQKRDDSYVSALSKIEQLHLDTITQLLSKPENQKPLIETIEQDFRDLGEVLRGIRLSGISLENNVELVSGFGEVWSAQFLNALLREQGLPSTWLDARKVLIVETVGKTVVIDWEKSSEKLNSWLKNNSSNLIVITGFVASTHEGVATTLKRNGSDYSGSIFGSLFDAEEIFIWTDVDGVFSADPRLVPEAVILDELTYDETAELAYFGAKVVHPSTMGPAMNKGIPIWIRNTFNPKHPGTKIHKNAKSERVVKGLSTIDQMALINIEGTEKVGVPNVAERLFSALCRADVSVMMISQASSEHSICFAIPQSQSEKAKKAAAEAFYAEIHQGLIESIKVTPSCSILAIVGDNMVHTPGVAGRLFKALGQIGVSVKAIAQGSSERNISAVIREEDAAKALRAVHSAFYLSDQTLSVGIIGSGLVGGALLNQLNNGVDLLRKERQIDIRVRGIMTGHKMVLDNRQIDLKNWEKQLTESDLKPDLEKFVSHLQSGQFPHSIIIDATATEEIPQKYPDWLSMGISVIAPNKRANTSSQSFYENLRTISRKNHSYFIYSTNVGAGLPIIQALRDLLQTGDKIMSIEGVLSGTLSYIFNEYNGEKSFSSIVKEAKAKGFTEPDPREDLSGMDVARKLVILAREMGLKMELDQVQVQSLVPQNLRKGNVDEFMKNLETHDSEMLKLLKDSLSKKEVLRYVGEIDETGKAKVQLKSFSITHAFSHLSGGDNIVAFRTARYNKQPLIIQGPGAGPEVTAAGVFADLLRLAGYFGAPL